jgi:hypothetical protein
VMNKKIENINILFTQVRIESLHLIGTIFVL